MFTAYVVVTVLAALDCIDLHTKNARKAGESEQRLYAIAAWHEVPFFNQHEQAALALTDAVTLIADTHVPAAVYDQAARHFDAQELALLTWQIAAINAWNRIAVTTRKTVSDTSPEPACELESEGTSAALEDEDAQPS